MLRDTERIGELIDRDKSGRDTNGVQTVRMNRAIHPSISPGGLFHVVVPRLQAARRPNPLPAPEARVVGRLKYVLWSRQSSKKRPENRLFYIHCSNDRCFNDERAAANLAVGFRRQFLLPGSVVTSLRVGALSYTPVKSGR